MKRRCAFLFVLAFVVTSCGTADYPVTILNGVVTDVTYRPIADLTVSVEQPALLGLVSEGVGEVRLSPDADGTFAVSELRAGDYRVVVSAPGYVTQTQMVTLQPPIPGTIEFRLERAPSS